MNEFKKAVVVLLSSLLFINGILWGTTYYVATDGDDRNSGSETDPFATIQKSIDTATTGNVVIVDEGVYYENIHFKGKNIILQSSDPNDPNVVASTVIVGDGRNSVVSFNGIEPVSCKLTGITITSANVEQGLVSHWKFDESTGNAKDSAGTNDGTLSGPTWQHSGGHIDGALLFDGIDDYVEIDGYKGILGSNSRTITAWIKAGAGGEGSIVHWGKHDVGKFDFMLNTSAWSGNVGAFRVSVDNYVDGVIDDGRIVGTRDLRDDKWHHVAAVIFDDGSPSISEVKIYVDGKAEPTTYLGDCAIDTISDGDVMIGAYPDPANPGNVVIPFHGSIDDVRIYDKSLDKGEIELLYAKNPTPPVSHWAFDGTSGSTAEDSVGDNDGILYGPIWQPSDGYFDGGLLFDGIDDYVDVSTFSETGDRFTFIAWINGEGPDWTGIISTRQAEIDGVDHIAGMLIGPGNELRYAWNDSSQRLWDWQSGLAIPEDQWAMVALVIEPAKATVYMYTDTDGLQSSVNAVTHSEMTVEGIKIGWEYGEVNRLFNGLIDDVQIYARDLSEVEIREIGSNHSGGIFGNETSATISKCVVTGNKSDSGGGILQCGGLIDNCTIINNKAIIGGGLSDCSGSIENTLFKNNIASGKILYNEMLAGGAIYNNKGYDPNVINCNFISNFGGCGGAIVNDCSSPNISRCTFLENSAVGFEVLGGAIYNYDSSATIDKCIFIENKVGSINLNDGGCGGAIANMNNQVDEIPGIPVITNCTFSWNIASGYGGGMSNIHADSYITNCVFTDNVAYSEGGGISNVFSDPAITNCTFKGNFRLRGSLLNYLGGGIYGSSSNPTFINCIIWNSFDPGAGNSIVGTARFKNCNIEGCGGSENWQTKLGTDLGGNIDVDPNFVNPVDPAGADGIFGTIDDGLIPGFGAACIDTGSDVNVPAGINFDIIGRARISDGDHDGTATVDMGAYEIPRTFFVNSDMSDAAGDGRNWDNAFKYLQDALGVAGLTSGDEILVAKGTYNPDQGDGYTSGTSSYSFELVEGVSMYGGFDGTDGSGFAGPAGLPRGFVRRDIENHETILSGNVGAVNSYHVVIGADNSILDGFTIRDGDAINDTLNPCGGGIYCNSTSTVISNCKITGNNAGVGGGIYGSSGDIKSCKIFGNSSGIANSSGFISNCLVNGNSGDGLYNCDGNIINNTVAYNTGDGLSNCDGLIANSVIWGNMSSQLSFSSDPKLSCIQNWTGDDTNISSDPKFVDIINGDYRLSLKTASSSQSPCINGGSSSYLAGNLDLDRHMRLVDFIPDMGAYESPKVWFVDDDITGGDGSSWTDAFDEIQDALDVCQRFAGHEIWVAAGSYKPSLQTDPNDPNTATFQLLDGVSIYGGFNTTEKYRSNRDWQTNITVLNGDIGTSGNNSDNCYHVITGSGVGLNTRLDGFTITGGNACSDTINDHKSGGGMYNYLVGPTVANCKFEGNYAVGDYKSSEGGGAVYNEASKPTFIQCIFNGNTSLRSGGAMYNGWSVAFLSECIFTNNHVLGYVSGCEGGAIINATSPLIVSGCTFTSNKAGDNSGQRYETGTAAVMLNSLSCPIITNCSFSNNLAFSGTGVMDNALSGPRIINCEFSNNRSIGFTGAPSSSSVIYNNNHKWEMDQVYPYFANCIFVDNLGLCAVENYDSASSFINCTFSRNLIGTGTTGVMRNLYSSPALANCIFYNNSNEIYNGVLSIPVITNCSIGVDPLFNTSDGAYGVSLLFDSPCIEAGDDSAVSGVPTDFAGNSRIFGAHVDIGAYEYIIP